MLEDMRKESGDGAQLTDDEELDFSELGRFAEEDLSDLDEDPRPRPQGGGNFLGMTPVQRFVLVAMIFALTCVLGFLLLLVSGAIALPL